MAKKSKMPDDQILIIKHLLWATWEYIGNDIMEALAQEGKYSISRNDVIEVVLDADHMSAVARTPSERNVLDRFKELSYKDRIAIAKTRFTYARYS